MNGFMLGVAFILAVAGLGLIIAPTVVFSRLNLTAPKSSGDQLIYRIGGITLLALAVILVVQLLSE